MILSCEIVINDGVTNSRKNRDRDSRYDKRTRYRALNKESWRTVQGNSLGCMNRICSFVLLFTLHPKIESNIELFALISLKVFYFCVTVALNATSLTSEILRSDLMRKEYASVEKSFQRRNNGPNQGLSKPPRYNNCSDGKDSDHSNRDFLFKPHLFRPRKCSHMTASELLTPKLQFRL